MSGSEHHIERAVSAWKRGNLSQASEWLKPLYEASPNWVDAACPYARVLHEMGESDRALEVLEPIVESPAAPSGLGVHRALIAWDIENEELLERDLSRLSETNRSGPALRSLSAARRGDWSSVKFTEAELWTSEVAGRFLSLLLREFTNRVEPSEDRFHHRTFCLEPLPAEGDVARDPEAPSGGWTVNAWDEALRELFRHRRFAEFVELWDLDAAKEWKEGLSREYLLVSHYASSSAHVALKHAKRVASESPEVSTQYLYGLCATRAGETTEARRALVASARLDDLAVNEVIRQLASELEITLQVSAE
ncbi:MAG: hypothetical protein AAF517_20830 [Planctomycetota bacterium]